MGVAAYGFQFINRAYLAFVKSGYNAFVLFPLLRGLLLMSQTNPGEFCPFPYEMLAVMIFVIIETRKEKGADSEKITVRRS